MKTLTTWQDFTGDTGKAVTTWNYDAQRGWLESKLYHDGHGPDYTYTPAGRLETRTWARTVGGQEIITTYSYFNDGQLAGMDYSDATPDVAFTYERWGGRSTMTDATGERTYTYRADLQPDQELLSEFFGDRIITRTYQMATSTGEPTSVPGRLSGFQLGMTGNLASDYAVSYGYDTAGRLKTVTSPHGAHSYTYVPNRPQLLATHSSPVHVTTRTYDPGRTNVAKIENKVGATLVSGYTYTLNNANQRVERAQAGTAFAAPSADVFAYNPKGELVESANTVSAAHDRAFLYDDIGNRTSSSAGFQPAIGYTVNTLNQYTSVGSVPSVVNPTYDLDGNQTATGAGQVYTWDGENRLIAVEPASPTSDGKKVVNTYDGQSRRVRRTVFTYDGSAWDVVTDEKFIYDGWNVIAVLDAADNDAVLRTHTWGGDLSGSMQGAGGVGGLLSVSDDGAVYHYTYDANGNVSEVLDATGVVAAHYEYDAFGDIVASGGSYAAANDYRFSTKPLDGASELYYYGLRYYNSSTGRWLNRDLIGENGGLGLYTLLNNSPVDGVDVLGLSGVAAPAPPVVLPSPPTPTTPTIGGPSRIADVYIAALVGQLVGGMVGDHLTDMANSRLEGLLNPDASEEQRVEACRALVGISSLVENKNRLLYSPTDGLGRATGAVGIIRRLEPGQDATRSPPGLRAANTHKPRSAASGHLIPRALGGDNRLDNLVTQDTNSNSGHINHFVEKPLREHFEKGGCAVCYVAIPRYRSDGNAMPAPSSMQFFIVYVGQPSNGLGRVQGRSVIMNKLSGNYNAESEPWRSIGLSNFPRGIGPVN